MDLYENHPLPKGTTMSIFKKYTINDRIKTMYALSEIFKWECVMASQDPYRKDELPELLDSYVSYLTEVQRLTEIKESKSLKNRLSRLIKK